jgi:hypothetical protein
MSLDLFQSIPSQLDSPARNAVAVTPNDGTDLVFQSRYIYVGGAGTLSVIMAGGQTVSFTCAAGALLPIMADRVRATGTTATLIVALW